jgi:hypothetical protein
MSCQSQSNGQASLFEIPATCNSITINSPRGNRVAGTSYAVAGLSKNETFSSNMKLSRQHTQAATATSEHFDKVHINSCSVLPNRNELNKVSLTTQKRQDDDGKRRCNISSVFQSQSNVRAQLSDLEACRRDITLKNSGYPNTRCPRTGLVVTRCSRTQSPKIDRLAAVWGETVQYVPSDPTWKTSPRDDEATGYLQRGSLSANRRSSFGLKHAVYGFLYDRTADEKLLGRGSQGATSSIAKPSTTSPVGSSPISSYKPASHHEPCFHM